MGIGFKSGGFNNGGSQAAIDLQYNQLVGSNLHIFDDFEKEVSSAFEAGFKADLLDRRFFIEGAAYHTNVDDMQFFEFFVGNFGILRVVSNIDKVRIWGAELAARWQVTPPLNLYAAGNVNDSRIVRNRARQADGGKSPYAADFAFNIGADLAQPVSDRLDLLARADVRVTGPTWFSTAQQGERPTIFNAILPPAGLPAFLGSSDMARSRRPTFTMVNARIGLGGERVRAVIYANNLFSERDLDEVIPAPDFGGSFISPGDRRSWGVEIGYRF